MCDATIETRPLSVLDAIRLLSRVLNVFSLSHELAHYNRTHEISYLKRGVRMPAVGVANKLDGYFASVDDVMGIIVKNHS